LRGPVVGAVQPAHLLHIQRSHGGQSTFDPPQLGAGPLQGLGGGRDLDARLLTKPSQFTAQLTAGDSGAAVFHIESLSAFTLCVKTVTLSLARPDESPFNRWQDTGSAPWERTIDRVSAPSVGVRRGYASPRPWGRGRVPPQVATGRPRPLSPTRQGGPVE